MVGLVYNNNHSTGRGLTAIEKQTCQPSAQKSSVRPFGANPRDAVLAKL
jgi:hypothetical protein